MAAPPIPPLDLNTSTTDTGSVMTSTALDQLKGLDFGIHKDQTGITNTSVIAISAMAAIVAVIFARR